MIQRNRALALARRRAAQRETRTQPYLPVWSRHTGPKTAGENHCARMGPTVSNSRQPDILLTDPVLLADDVLSEFDIESAVDTARRASRPHVSEVACSPQIVGHSSADILLNDPNLLTDDSLWKVDLSKAMSRSTAVSVAQANPLSKLGTETAAGSAAAQTNCAAQETQDDLQLVAVLTQEDREKQAKANAVDLTADSGDESELSQTSREIAAIAQWEIDQRMRKNHCREEVELNRKMTSPATRVHSPPARRGKRRRTREQPAEQRVHNSVVRRVEYSK